MLTKNYRKLYLSVREFFNSIWDTYSPKFGQVEFHAKLRVAAGSKFFEQAEKGQGFQAYVRYFNAQESFQESALSFVYLGENQKAKQSLRTVRKCLLKAIELTKNPTVTENPMFDNYSSSEQLEELLDKSQRDYLIINREQTRRRLCKERLGRFFPL